MVKNATKSATKSTRIVNVLLFFFYPKPATMWLRTQLHAMLESLGGGGGVREVGGGGGGGEGA